ncbi:MAG: hypothetical protein K8J31_06105 [Anaerolineae bacterium]|nr:hypothetical protein [Anaerolineae bacterium]
MYEIPSEQQQKLMALYAQVYEDTLGKMPDLSEILRDALAETHIVFRSAVAHNTGGYNPHYLAVLSLLREIVLMQNREKA